MPRNVPVERVPHRALDLFPERNRTSRRRSAGGERRHPSGEPCDELGVLPDANEARTEPIGALLSGAETRAGEKEQVTRSTERRT